MAKWSFSNPSWTPVSVNDTTTMTANGACFLQGGGTAQRINVMEVYAAGQASASAVTPLVLARDSTVGVTSITLGTSGKNAPLDVHTVALAAPQVAGFSATTMPQRAATLHLINLGLNAFGGIVRWLAAPGEEINLFGNAVNVGELSLSAIGGSPGAIGTHIIYEPF